VGLALAVCAVAPAASSNTGYPDFPGASPSAVQTLIQEARDSRSSANRPAAAPAVPTGVDENLVMGNPSNAAATPDTKDNFLMRKTEYTLSYNNSAGTPNWVSWHLNASWLGTADRQNNFRPDTDVPQGWLQVVPAEYENTGFDKGHMCNSKDRTRDTASNSATFLMTNMVPQSPKNNEHTWEGLEQYSRVLASKGDELYIVSGPWGKGGEGSKGKMDTLTVKRGAVNAEIVVPAFTWKVILILPQGKTSPADVTKDAKTLAVIMPNTQEIDLDWKKYITTVAKVEELTHFKFFSEVAPAVAAEIDQQTYAP
ncbi:MAG: DNA/RNA non-specific endonuclease, partial [Elusimicrobiota bacterium]